MEIIFLTTLFVGAFLAGLFIMKWIIQRELRKLIAKKDRNDLKLLLNENGRG